MKILHIISDGYPSGGAETTLIKLKASLEKRGHEVKILSSDLRPEVTHFSDFEFKSINSKSPLRILFNLFNPYSFVILKNILSTYKPDIVHLHTMYQASPSVLFLLKKYPTLMTLHGPETFLTSLVVWDLLPRYFNTEEVRESNLTPLGKLHYFYRTYVQRYMYTLVLKNVDLYISPSNFIRNKVSSDVKPIKIIHNPVDLPEYSEIKYNKNILFVGRLEKIKGVRYLIETVSLVTKKIPDAQLYIVGDGDEKDDLVKLAGDMGLSKNVHFTGWLKNAEVVHYYKIASVVVIPSIWPENFPTVCLEAMSVGRPVIGTAVGGIPEIIDSGINGYLVEPKNSAAIADKIIRLLLDRDLLKKLSKNARIKSETYTVETYITQMEEVYQDIMRKYENK